MSIHAVRQPPHGYFFPGVNAMLTMEARSGIISVTSKRLEDNMDNKTGIICPECGRSYTAGGVTKTVTKADNSAKYTVGDIKLEKDPVGKIVNVVA